MASDWEKLDKHRYRNTRNGAFIAIFNFGGTTGRVPCVYLNEREYRGGCADYRSAGNLKEAKALGDKIETLNLIPVHTR